MQCYKKLNSRVHRENILTHAIKIFYMSFKDNDMQQNLGCSAH